MRGAACGVDGCRAGWFYFCLQNEDYAFGVARTIAETLEVTGSDRVLVDVPIGLRDGDGTPRACDQLARRLLGPRRSSVFTAPIRDLLTLADYQAANQLSRRLTGRGLSRQTFAIMPRVAEMDRLLSLDGAARSAVREAHPELCFWGLAGGSPLAHNKKTQAGFQERLEILARHWPPAEEAIAQAYLWCSTSGAARDDVVDALVLAVTASQPTQELRSLPAQAEADGQGLPMEMVYFQSGVARAVVGE